jgi:hypothetical protein
MKITLKTLQENNYPIEVDPSSTIETVGKKYFELLNTPPQRLTFFFQGKILAPTGRLDEYGIVYFI